MKKAFRSLLSLPLIAGLAACIVNAAGPTPSGVNVAYAVAGSGTAKIYTGTVVNAYGLTPMQGVVVAPSVGAQGRSAANGAFEARAASDLLSLSVGGLSGYVYTRVPAPKAVNFGKLPVFSNDFLLQAYAELGLVQNLASNYQGGVIVVNASGAPIQGATVEGSTTTTGMYGLQYLDNTWGSVSFTGVNSTGLAGAGVTGDTGTAFTAGAFVSNLKNYVVRVSLNGVSCNPLTRAPYGFATNLSSVSQRIPGPVETQVFVCAQ